MRLVCPECGATGSVAQFSADPDARAVAEMLAQQPASLGAPLLGYLGLFRPAKRALTWPRAHRLLQELCELMQSPAVQRRGRDWPVTPQMWQAALVQMVDGRDRLTLPLKSHGYLLEIVVGLADKAEAHAETKHDADLRAGFKAGRDAPARLDKAARVAQAVASENAARKRLKMPPLNEDEIPEFLKREGIA